MPAWHEAHRELPFLFVGSAAAAGAGFGLVAGPLSETEPARRMAVAGALTELVAEQPMPACRPGADGGWSADGRHGRRAQPNRRRGRRGALLAGSALTRFGIFAGGMQSARDPRYTVEPQRARLPERQAAS